MTARPLKPCSAHGCRKPTDHISGYCVKHVELYEQKKADEQKSRAVRDFRVPSSQRGYGAIWRKIRAYKLRKDPLCEDCLKRSFAVAAEVVHHKDENQFNNDDKNLQSLCRDCHEITHGRKAKEWQ